MADEDSPTFEGINERLKQIAEDVSDESLPLDDALDLFEEAVQLGLQASNLLEDGVSAQMQGASDGSSTPDGEDGQAGGADGR